MSAAGGKVRRLAIDSLWPKHHAHLFVGRLRRQGLRSRRKEIRPDDGPQHRHELPQGQADQREDRE